MNNILQVIFKSKLRLLEENQQLRWAYDRMYNRFVFIYSELDDEKQERFAYQYFEKSKDFDGCPRDY